VLRRHWAFRWVQVQLLVQKVVLASLVERVLSWAVL
jgi:hypothetical protein